MLNDKNKIRKIQMLKCKIYVKFFLISENMGVVSLDEAGKIHILNNFNNTLELLRDGGCNDVTIIYFLPTRMC